MSEGKRRRKSLSILRPPMTALTPITHPSGNSSPISLLRKRRPDASGPSSPIAPSPTSSDIAPPSPRTPIEMRHKSSMDRLAQKARPRSLQKSTRPLSLFGSFRGGLSPQDEDEDPLTRTSSYPSVHSQSEYLSGLATSQVLLNGDVQTASGVFRKKSQYLVLTETHLVKFRSQSRASDMFPSIPSSMGRASGARHSRLSSSGSFHDLHAPNEGLQAIPLNQIVAIYRLDDGKPYFSIELSHLDEEIMQASSMILQLHDPNDAELWLSSIRGAAMNSRLKDPLPFSKHLVEYTARLLEQDRDYDPHQFHMFRVVQRSGKLGVGSRSSSDDLSKLSSSVCILAIGMFKLHLIPLPKSSKTLSSTSLAEFNGISYGIASLTEFTVADDNESFLLKVRTPLRQRILLPLASSCVNDIALSARRTLDFLRPKWPQQPFTWNYSEIMDEQNLPVPPIDEEHEAFNRTLAAYCAAYDIDVAGIRYTVDLNCEDRPAFCLAHKADGRRYTVLELLAVMRALRYNESFGTLSFAGINLDELQRLRDPHGDEHVAWITRSGQPLNKEEEKQFSLLVQEVRALALNSLGLRRLNFSYCLTSKGSSLDSGAEDLGCGICEGLFSICAKHATNIDWVVLNGIPLSEVDLDYLYTAALDRSCHFRAIDVSRCGLEDRNMDTVLNALANQGDTLESLDISSNPARLDPHHLSLELRSFDFIRVLNLSNISRVSTSNPLLPADLLLKWKLEALHLAKTALNEQSVDAIAVYLQSPQSAALKFLDVDQCQLSGRDVATLFESSWTDASQGRDLRMSLSGNRVETGHDALVNAIRREKCPSQIVIQMIDYQDERNFRRLLDAFSANKVVLYLDLSKILLPSDADKATCESLGRLLTSNTVLKYLDISGEQTHLVASSLGPGLNSALLGLKRNNSLEVLRLQHQRLGLQGASTLASVLEANRTLREVHCEGNEINLQAFTVLVNSLEGNKTLMHLPDMAADRAWAQKKVDREVDSLRESTNGGVTTISSTKATVKRTLGRTMTGQKSHHSRVSSGLVPEYDIRGAIGSLSRQWDKEIARLHGYLARNYNIAHGLPLEVPGPLAFDRPGTSGSLETAIRNFGLEQTPRAELNRQLGETLNGQESEGHVEGSEDEIEEAESPLEMRKP